MGEILDHFLEGWVRMRVGRRRCSAEAWMCVVSPGFDLVQYWFSPSLVLIKSWFRPGFVLVYHGLDLVVNSCFRPNVDLDIYLVGLNQE